jgi:hypothetical protein
MLGVKTSKLPLTADVISSPVSSCTVTPATSKPSAISVNEIMPLSRPPRAAMFSPPYRSIGAFVPGGMDDTGSLGVNLRPQARAALRQGARMARLAWLPAPAQNVCPAVRRTGRCTCGAMTRSIWRGDQPCPSTCCE